MTTTPITRRSLLAGAAAGSAALISPGAGLAQAYPTRPVRFVIGFPAGGVSDAISRLLGAELSKSLGQQFVVESKPGASGNIATQAVLGAPADGHTIYLAQINLATNPFVMDVGYDPAKALTMVSQIVSIPVVMLTNPKSGLKSVQDVVAAGKARNGELKFGGVLGTSSHLGPELFARDQGFTFKFVPYRGGALAVQALMSEEVDVVCDLMSGTLKGLVEAGQVHGVAILQDAAVKGLEKIPPAGASGVSPAGFFRSWMGVAVRAGTPAPIVARLHEAVVAAVGRPDLREKLEQLGNEVVTSPDPAAFQSYYTAETARLGELIKAIGYKPQ
ncbi:MAG: tripartite tricarboxylate transporter substrate binding protein [Beijerinckiaceae bacterium]|nr:tripartite tricarboxylate transporter substrate binding protein [Beijerinckiaceae bacterium]